MKRSPVTFVDSNELCISFSKRFLDQFKKNVLWVLLTCNDILFKLSANVNNFWIYIFEESNYVVRENMLQISNLLTELEKQRMKSYQLYHNFSVHYLIFLLLFKTLYELIYLQLQLLGMRIEQNGLVISLNIHQEQLRIQLLGITKTNTLFVIHSRINHCYYSLDERFRKCFILDFYEKKNKK